MLKKDMQKLFELKTRINEMRKNTDMTRNSLQNIELYWIKQEKINQKKYK